MNGETEKKYAVIGNLDYNGNSLNGQTIKTRCIKDTLDYLLSHRVVIADTAEAKKKPLATVLRILKILFTADAAFVALQKNGIRYILPLCFFAKVVRPSLILNFFAIGGRLHEFLVNDMITRNSLKKFDTVFVETDKMQEGLNLLGFTNSKVFPNFRFFKEEDIRIERKLSKEPLKCMFLARVSKNKGVEIAMEAINILRNKDLKVQLHIYGAIESGYEKRFFELLKRSEGSVYKETIDPYSDDFYKIVSEYDLMILPTFYKGEGFPGTFIDAFVAGLPVIASDWNYNRSLIDDGRTGVIMNENTPAVLAEWIAHFNENREALEILSANAIQESQKFNSIKLFKELI